MKILFESKLWLHAFDFVLKSVNILIFMLLVYVFKTIVNNILGLGNLI